MLADGLYTRCALMAIPTRAPHGGSWPVTCGRPSSAPASRVRQHRDGSGDLPAAAGTPASNSLYKLGGPLNRSYTLYRQYHFEVLGLAANAYLDSP
jgi:hypothetical protein